MNYILLPVVIALIVGAAFGAMFQQDRVNDFWHKYTVSQGAAEYILDPATGKTAWRWRSPQGWKGEVKP